MHALADLRSQRVVSQIVPAETYSHQSPRLYLPARAATNRRSVPALLPEGILHHQQLKASSPLPPLNVEGSRGGSERISQEKRTPLLIHG